MSNKTQDVTHYVVGSVLAKRARLGTGKQGIGVGRRSEVGGVCDSRGLYVYVPTFVGAFASKKNNQPPNLTS
eukprot:scaffold181165_cov31-Tisochrysis_lutea.AAC.2